MTWILIQARLPSGTESTADCTVETSPRPYLSTVMVRDTGAAHAKLGVDDSRSSSGSSTRTISDDDELMEKQDGCILYFVF